MATCISTVKDRKSVEYGQIIHSKEAKKIEIKRKKRIRLFLCTWNVSEEKPPDDLTHLLDLKTVHLPDIYAIGLQEVNVRDKGLLDNAWTEKLTNTLCLFGFMRLKVRRLQGILLQVFVKKTLLPKIKNIESESTKTGMGGYYGNKGGVSIRFDINSINLIIVNCHLAAHMDQCAERIEDFDGILDGQKFRDEDTDNILDHDYVFWMGDTNFRLDNTPKRTALRLISENDIPQLLKLDQLTMCREEDVIFPEFREGPIDFLPTYKFDKETDTYDTSPKQRVPAWCDRILWLIHEDAFENVSLSLEQLHYKSRPSFKQSDHKPVTAAFDIDIFDEPSCLPVTFQSVDKWKYGQTGEFSYSVSSNISRSTSSWDWIGLYKANFKSVRNYVTYAWATKNAEKNGGKDIKCTISSRYLKVMPGKYYLCYISNYKDHLLGISNIFEIPPFFAQQIAMKGTVESGAVV